MTFESSVVCKLEKYVFHILILFCLEKCRMSKQNDWEEDNKHKILQLENMLLLLGAGLIFSWKNKQFFSNFFLQAAGSCWNNSLFIVVHSAISSAIWLCGEYYKNPREVCRYCSSKTARYVLSFWGKIWQKGYLDACTIWISETLFTLYWAHEINLLSSYGC